MTRHAVITMLSAAGEYDLAVEWVQEMESRDTPAMAAYAAEDWPAFDSATEAFWAGWCKEDIAAEFDAYAAAVIG